jgi:hypothetical protein
VVASVWQFCRVPGYVEEELRGYLECGLLCCGFGRGLCTGCGAGFVVAFSCKGRGVCPSCNGRHMVQTAAHLADYVISPVPVWQWMISVPKRLRGMLADRPALHFSTGVHSSEPGCRRSSNPMAADVQLTGLSLRR